MVIDTSPLTLNATGVYFPIRYGTGNQLFIFACAYATARRLNTKLYLRTGWNARGAVSAMSDHLKRESSVLPFFDFPEDLASDLPIPEHVKTPSGLKAYLSKAGVRTRWLQRSELISSTSWGKFREELQTEGEGPLLYTTGEYCWGEGFFRPFKDEIIQLLNFRKIRTWTEESEAGSGWLKRIQGEQNPVMVHIRKGDYVELTSKPSHLAPISYYISGMELMRNVFGDKNATFFVFSDSMDLVKKELAEEVKFSEFKDKVYFVSSNELPSLMEFYLMTECTSGITSRSTFSWWAAYLMRRGMGGKVVVAPKGIPGWWENAGLLPSSWVVLEDEEEIAQFGVMNLW